MTIAELAAALSDVQAVALTLDAEARNQGLVGLVAAGNVMRNRVLDPRWPDTYRGVVFQRKQFSCWIPGGGQANYTRTIRQAEGLLAGKVLTPMLRTCLVVAEGIIAGLYRDVSRQSTHYMTKELWDGKRPRWAKGLKANVILKDHVFFSAA